MAIYSEFSHSKWWFSIVTLVYQRVPENLMTWFLSQFICHWMFDQQKHPAWRICSHTSPEKKPLPTSVPYQTNPWQKWNFWSTGACTPCYCTTLHLAAVGRHDDGQLGSFDLCQRCWISISIIPAIPMVKTHPSGYLIVNQSNQSMIVDL